MIRRNILVLMTLAALAGCSIGGTSPDPGYYSLAPVPGPVLGDVAYVVKIMRPGIPGYLDRPEIVEQDSDYDVQIDDSRRWAEPLDTMLERILVQDLRQRLPAAHLITEDDGFAVTPRVTIALAIQQFNRAPHGQVALQAALNIRDEGTHDQPPLQTINDTLDADSGTAGALSALVGKLADGIATLLHNQAVQGDRIAPQPPKPRFEG